MNEQISGGLDKRFSMGFTFILRTRCYIHSENIYKRSRKNKRQMKLVTYIPSLLTLLRKV